MLPQADDLRAEAADFHAFLDRLSPSDWDRPTPFKSWTPNDVVAHLHMGDWMAALSMTDEAAFDALLVERRKLRDKGMTGSAHIGPRMERGRALLEQWHAFHQTLCDLLAARNPTDRVKWVGPSMSVRMCATARQMETWAHAQDIYDMLRAPRTHADRIRNIAEIGVRTYGWTFANRGLEPPGPVPFVRLVAPSGAIWQWGEATPANRVEGSAVEFCQVVTQGRNIADVGLTVIGEPATKWMAIAQCFAGDPKDPPAKGERAWS
jgi:uncharacterized protein (TIGR03084 family)